MNSHRQFHKRLEEVDLLISLIPEKPTSKSALQMDALTRASIVLLCSHLEGFLKDLIEEFVSDVNGFSLSFKALPEELYVQHSFPKAKVPQAGFAGLLEVVREIKTLSYQDEVIRLKKANFSITGGNPKPDMINEIFRVLGHEKILDVLNLEIKNFAVTEEREPFLKQEDRSQLVRDLGSIEAVDKLDRLLAEKYDSKTKKKTKGRDVGFYYSVNRLLELRNDIAHGNMRIKVSLHDLEMLREDISLLAEALSNKAEQRLRELIDEKQNGER